LPPSAINDTQDTTAQAEPGAGVLMLGMGWFPDSLGGLDRYYRELYEQLPGAGGVVVGPAPGAPPRVAVASRHDAPLLRRLAAYRAATRRQAAGAQVIDSHFALYAAAATLGAPRRPSVFHFHGPWAQESLAGPDASRLRFRLRRALERRALRASDAQVVLSSAFRRVLLERYRIAPWDIHVWPPGVDPVAFSAGDRELARRTLELAPGAFVAACVRRLVPRMGIEVLLDAWRRTLERLPPGSTLLLVGEGPLAGELQASVTRHGLDASVRLLGRISDDALREVYRAADTAVVPSLSVEGFGLVVLEAAACGTPSVVSDVGGLGEAVAGLDRSLVVSPGDPEALAQRLGTAATGALPDRELTRRYAARFTWPALAERHLELYARLRSGTSDERLRVVYVDHVARLSGGEIAILRLLPHLSGVHPHVILAEEGPLVERLQQAGVSVEVLALAPGARDLRREAVRIGADAPLAALGAGAYAFRLARRLRAIEPDVVHANSLKSGLYGGLAARLAGVPLVWHLRDRLAEDYLPAGAVRAMRTLVPLLSTAVIANSAATLETLPARGRRRGLVIPDSVLAPAAAPDRPLDAPPSFGILGRIAPWKGQDLFLRAFAEAFPAGPQRAVLVGEPMFGEHDFERELHELADELGLRERVEFRGFREDVWEELGRLDVLVHASTIPEPFGQVVLEGMAAGLPVIAPDEGGPAEVVEHERTGILFTSRDVRSLAAAMASLAADGEARSRLGAAARRQAEAFDPRALAGRYEELYGQLARAPGPQAAGDAGR
jgi:glycosyltransferase involved in cell wall biosynthesis